MKTASIFIFLLIVFTTQVQATTWQDVVSQVTLDLKKDEADRRETRNMIHEERERLTAQLSELKKATEADEEALNSMKNQFEALLEKEETLRGKTETEEADVQSLEIVVRTSAKDLDRILSESMIIPESPGRRDLIAPLLDPDRFPGMEDIKNLVDIWFDEAVLSGEVRLKSGSFIVPQGGEESGDLIRVGKFITFYRKHDKTGYLRYDPAIGKLAVIPGKPPWMVRRSIDRYFEGKSIHLPLDLSGGIIVEQLNRKSEIREWLESGGLLVWPILIIGVIALFLCIERFYILGRIPTQTDRIMDRVRELALQGDFEACKEICETKKNVPSCNVLNSGFDYREASREVMENAVEESILKELPRLERFLTTLSVLAAIAPLLGLLGTVTGMIHTFQGITVFGTSDPRMMSGGISEALITTQLGLSVAIPVMIAHHYFDRRVEKIIGDMEEKGTALITTLLKLN